MALLPTLPTSFVPPSASSAVSTYRSNALSFFAYAILGIVFVLAIGVFLYGRLLASELSSKETFLHEAETAIDLATVESFVRLRDRLASGENLLDGHVAFSGFFSSLEKLLPTTVRFSSLHLSVDIAGVSRVEGTGSAKSFNALASASTAFSEDGRIKDAIFSNITINEDSSVSFVLSATLDPKLTAFSP